MELILGLKHYQRCSSPIPVMNSLPFTPSPTLTTDKCPAACKCWGWKIQKLWQCIRVWTVYQCQGSIFALIAGKTAYTVGMSSFTHYYMSFQNQIFCLPWNTKGFPFDISLVLHRVSTLSMGKKPFFLFNWSLFQSRSYNCTWLVCVGLKNKPMHGGG